MSTLVFANNKNEGRCFFFNLKSFFINQKNITQYNIAALNRYILHEFKYNKNITNFKMKLKNEKYQPTQIYVNT